MAREWSGIVTHDRQEWHVFFHLDFGGADPRIDRLLAHSKELLMAAADVKAALKKIDVATNNIAEDVKRLKDLIKIGMTPDEVAEVQGEADRLAAKLEGIAADTEDPTP